MNIFAKHEAPSFREVQDKAEYIFWPGGGFAHAKLSPKFAILLSVFEVEQEIEYSQKWLSYKLQLRFQTHSYTRLDNSRFH